MSRRHAFGLETVLQRRKLIVINPKAPGCCPDVPRPADTVTCKPRAEDGERLWFFTSWGKPIAEADRIVDAAELPASTSSGERLTELALLMSRRFSGIAPILPSGTEIRAGSPG
ncbi:hypothetical protein [Actinomadura roseirufa]|uniref:hypothetical protein n=1 Tax=Actinomadura roseirufa TaxID=2094049 RepID=UPI0010411451|nr:hypothetical protein [Actinomadura roseirufa]